MDWLRALVWDGGQATVVRRRGGGGGGGVGRVDTVEGCPGMRERGAQPEGQDSNAGCRAADARCSQWSMFAEVPQRLDLGGHHRERCLELSKTTPLFSFAKFQTSLISQSSFLLRRKELVWNSPRLRRACGIWPSNLVGPCPATCPVTVGHVDVSETVVSGALGRPRDDHVPRVVRLSSASLEVRSPPLGGCMFAASAAFLGIQSKTSLCASMVYGSLGLRPVGGARV